MGNCLGSRKPSGNRLDTGATPNAPPTAKPDADAARKMRLEAAENRQHQRETRGVQGSGGKLSKNLQAQNKLKPGQETENSVERVIWD
ncbi:hypothetical protein Unana1_03877 [Umbelopsis nana]